MTDVDDMPARPDDEPDEPDEPDDDDALDWAAADVAQSDLEDISTEAVADGDQDMPEEEAGWANAYNRPRSAERAV